MIITCTKCSTHFSLDDSLVKAKGTKCRCTVCKHVFTAYPLIRDPEPLTSEPLTSEPLESDNLESDNLESDSVESETWESELWDSEKATKESTRLNLESDHDDDNLFKETDNLEIDFDFSSADSELDIENPYLEKDEFDPGDSDDNFDDDLYEDLADDDLADDHDDLGDDDLAFDENTFDLEEDGQEQTLEGKENLPEFEDKEIQFDPIKFDDVESDPFEDEPASLTTEKSEPEKDSTFFSPDQKNAEEMEPSILSENFFPKEDDNLKMEPEPEGVLEEEFKIEDVLPERELEPEDSLPEKDIEPEGDLPEKPEKDIHAPPRKVIVKPKPVAAARPKRKKEKKKSQTKIPVLILLLILFSGLFAYIASVMTGYKLPDLSQYIKKPVPEISEVKPIPNQKSVNGRFVTNSTAGTLFVITGRVENPSNISYSHIKIRGALITKNKQEAKIKNVFCGNIITEEMLKTGNIADINTLMMLKEGAHKINVNVKPAASVPFMVVFSDLPEELQNFTIKIDSFDKAIN
ncbi:zinc-ribbon domain-containing protein [Desulfobacula sp.]